MLLQTDRYPAQGVSTVTVPAVETVPGPGLTECSERHPVGSERVPAGSRFMCHDRWLVGLQFHTADFQHVWFYYVVDEANDTTHAVRMAVRRADSDPARVARGGIQAEADQVEVQQILQDALGRFSLTRSLCICSGGGLCSHRMVLAADDERAGPFRRGPWSPPSPPVGTAS